MPNVVADTIIAASAACGFAMTTRIDEGTALAQVALPEYEKNLRHFARYETDQASTIHRPVGCIFDHLVVDNFKSIAK